MNPRLARTQALLGRASLIIQEAQREMADLEHALENLGTRDNDDLRTHDIAELEISVRAFNCLKRMGVETVADLLIMFPSEKDLVRIPNMGIISVNEITTALAQEGLFLTNGSKT